MGEYANYRGDHIKIGTCEDMYYLRADQRAMIQGYRFTPGEDRFRFPFPDEDTIEPGHFEDHNRAERIPGWQLPNDFADGHHGVQFHAEPGYLLYLPCPEGGEFPEAIRDKLGRNGWHGGVGVCQQREVDGEMRVIVTCLSCGAKWNLPREHAAEVAEAFLNEAERKEWRGMPGEHVYAHTDDTRRYLAVMARRILAGYEEVVAA